MQFSMFENSLTLFCWYRKCNSKCLYFFRIILNKKKEELGNTKLFLFFFFITHYNKNGKYTFTFKVFKISFHLISSCMWLEHLFQASAAVIQHNWTPLPLIVFLHDRNVLMKPFTMLSADVWKVYWKAIQVQIKTVCFQWHTVLHNSADYEHFLNQQSVVWHVVSAQKVAKNRSECFPHCLLS
jgi:hypothetical protein